MYGAPGAVLVRVSTGSIARTLYNMSRSRRHITKLLLPSTEVLKNIGRLNDTIESIWVILQESVTLAHENSTWKLAPQRSWHTLSKILFCVSLKQFQTDMELRKG